MKSITTFTAAAAILLPAVLARLGEDGDATRETIACDDPVGAVLGIMKCIEDEDAACVSAGYDNRAFKKINNGVDTKTNLNFGFWTGAFRLMDFGLDINHAMEIGPNQISLRYVEIVNTTSGTDLFLSPSTEYPFSQTFLQHEHALVTVDDDCKMVLWDQYGDNEEQDAVVDAVDVIVCQVNPFCFD